MNRAQQLVASLREKRDTSIIRAQEAEKKIEENKRLLKEKTDEALKLQQRLEYSRSFMTLAKQWEATQKRLRVVEEKAARLGPKVEHLEYETDQLQERYNESRKQEKKLLEDLASLEI
ncbi:hypothetical protein BDQ17DRAFT_323013 [Cyathus striatus]|nr:hypothetical protein BDQ17DRAFT_323013 [Cyathus striatus]